MAESAIPSSRPFRERIGALRHLPSLFRLVWHASPILTAASLGLRLTRAALPVLVLYVGKLIIDDVVLLVQTPNKPQTLSQWLNSGLLNWLGLLLLAEFALAVLSDILGRVVSLIDSLLSERAAKVGVVVEKS